MDPYQRGAPTMDPYQQGGRPSYGDNPRGGNQYNNQGFRPEQPRHQQKMRNDDYEERGYSEYTATNESRYSGTDDKVGPRLIGVTFVGLGVLLLALAVIEVMLCLDHGYYCLFWTGALVFEFGMFTFIHNGEYDKIWKNVLVLTLGLVAGVAVHASAALVMRPLAMEFLTAGRAINNTDFELRWHLLAFNVNETSHVSIANETQPWVCIGINGSSMFVLMVSFLVLTATAVMTNRIWRYVNDEDEEESFGLCRPRLFNPYGQLSAAQALSFIGIVTIYATTATNWQIYWTPVWTAGLVCGIISAKCDKKQSSFLS